MELVYDSFVCKKAATPVHTHTYMINTLLHCIERALPLCVRRQLHLYTHILVNPHATHTCIA